MKCVSIRKCQAIVDGKAITFDKGDVFDFVICPPHFRPIEGEEAMPINFDTAQEQELLESDFDLDKLREYIETTYDKKPGNRGKEKLVELLLDCRFRSISEADLKGVF